MSKTLVGQNRSDPKNISRFAHSKSTLAYLIIALAFVACTSKKSKGPDNAPELVHFDSLEGEVHQLTTVGSNFDISFSPIFNQLAYVHDDPQAHRTPQIYVKNMIDKTERRLTYNLGENLHPQFHPYKKWIVYSSSADNIIEKVNVGPVLKDLGLSQSATAAMKNNKFFDIYVMNEEASDLKRITHNRSIDHLATFTRDGEKIDYVSLADNNSQILQYDMRSGQKKTLATSTDPITSLSVSQDLMAYTTEKKLIVKKLKGNETVYESPEGFYFGDVSLHPQDQRLLVISNFEDKNNKDVYLLDLEKKCTTRLTFHPKDELSPSFGPEGKSLFFVSNRSMVPQIYSMLIRDSLPCKSWSSSSKIGE